MSSENPSRNCLDLQCPKIKNIKKKVGAGKLLLLANQKKVKGKDVEKRAELCGPKLPRPQLSAHFTHNLNLFVRSHFLSSSVIFSTSHPISRSY